MLALQSITDEIADLKASRRAVILAHHYQDHEIQDLADAVGDSLELARKARDFSGDVIAFCGVWFMAETAEAAFVYQQKLEKGDKKVVGVNCHIDTVEKPMEILRVSHEVEVAQVRELADRRQ